MRKENSPENKMFTVLELQFKFTAYDVYPQPLPSLYSILLSRCSSAYPESLGTSYFRVITALYILTTIKTNHVNIL